MAAYHGHNNHNGHTHHHNNSHRQQGQPRYRDSAPLRDLKVKQNKHILSTYNKAYAFFPKVRPSNQRVVAVAGGLAVAGDMRAAVCC